MYRLMLANPCRSPREQVTELGKLASTVPASPRLGLMLVLGKMWDCLTHATALVAVPRPRPANSQYMPNQYGMLSQYARPVKRSLRNHDVKSFCAAIGIERRRPILAHVTEA